VAKAACVANDAVWHAPAASVNNDDSDSVARPSGACAPERVDLMPPVCANAQSVSLDGNTLA